MSDTTSGVSFFGGRAFWAVTSVLTLEILAFYTIPKGEFVPSPPPLRALSRQIGDWRMTAEYDIDEETRQFLKADDTLNRFYADGSSKPLSLFVAFFKSQRAGVTPHSPKVCLPGNGWTPEDSTRIMVNLPDGTPLRVNRFVVSRGEQRSIVYYWYQTAHRVLADEYVSKAYLMIDGLRYRRSDEALLRVISSVEGEGEAAAEERAIRFIQAIFTPLKSQMWVSN